MRIIIIAAIFSIAFCGCSSLGSVTAPIGSCDILIRTKLPQTDRWNWFTELYCVSEDHTKIERVENRAGDWHVNVNKFVEPLNCTQCLKIGKPEIQSDNSLKVKVALTHPFPGNPEYTGFDVRGTIIFPATRYWKRQPPSLYNDIDGVIFDDFDPFYFSRAEDGGGQLLNADGFTIYLFPGLDIIPHLPITKYSKGKHSNGPDPDSTINGYKLFTNDPERRMFRVNDSITRTYHISPPQGEFFFGYVVDASWAQPSKLPVTDPAVDFPLWANCEDGYVTEFVQNVPFYTGTYDQLNPPTSVDTNVTTVTILHNMICFPISGGHASTYLLCPDITHPPTLKGGGVAWGVDHEYPTDNTQIDIQRIKPGTYAAEPGVYVALMYARLEYIDPNNPNPKQITSPPVFAFIKLHVEKGNW